MVDAPPSTPPAPMEGGGAYNRSSRVQASGLAPGLGLLEEAAKAAPLPPVPQPIVIADYGASQGHNSLLPMKTAIAALRARAGVERAICVVHTDLPDNDFTGLFHTLQEDPQSYAREDRAVFPSAVGRSFYEQLLPCDSVAVGWSSWAVQWLSRAPAPVPDQVQVAYSRDAAARAAFARQADEDWRAFLASRSRELAPGASVVVLTMASSDAGEFGYRPLLEALWDGLGDLVNEGLLTADEVRRMVIPTVARRREEFAAPFAGTGRFESLALEHLEIFFAEDRIYDEYEASGDVHAYAAAWTAFTRASVFPTLAEGLAGGVADPRAKEFMDRLDARVKERLAVAPQRMEMPMAKMAVVKTG